ncbi:MAG: CocE/NonD family hydrolase [Armatimonadetes bacterium]|nr:CocE/NonD family hydrolase [Armatimonadota bacterium]
MSETGYMGIIEELDVEVPMRDGVILRANVFRPDAPGKFPGLLMRTPYGKGGRGGYARHVRAGYAVVAMDSRGRYTSDGQYANFVVEHTGDAEDGYDSVEWLAAQPWCDGNVGTFGASYCAWMQWQLARLRPPSLKAMCAYTIPLEVTGVDWWGSFRPGRRLHWWLTTIAPDLRRRAGMPPPHTPAEAREIWHEIEHGRWLYMLPYMDFCDFLPEPLATQAREWLDDPARPVWKFAEAHHEIEVPNLDFSGYFDHCNESMLHLPGMQKNARTAVAREQTKLIIGPYNHGGFGKRKLGDIDFGPQAEFDLTDIMLRWFDHWLKGIDNGVDREPACRYFVMGSGEWKSAGTWPPEDTGEMTLYLGSDGSARPVSECGSLSADGPEGDEPDEYVYDPRNPTPTLWSPSLFTLPSDRRRLEHREDILYYCTEPLEEEVEVVGYPEVVLYAASSAPDTDFFARLVDEDPEGIALEICYGMVRARHRNSWHEEELIKPGRVYEYRIKLGATACRFLKGHRIRLEVCSADFPNHDRNHNTGGDDLRETELVPARQQVFHSAEYPSRLIMSVNPV